MEPILQRDPAAASLPSACTERSLSLPGELWLFVCATGKWWLVPILVALLLLGAVMLLSASGAGPFIYTLF